MKQKRIFIAIKIYPDNFFLEYFTQIQKALEHEKIRWVKKENLHLTLRFLGDCDHSVYAEIPQKLDEIAQSTHDFNLLLKGLGVFRSVSYPKVIWAGINDVEDLKKLRQNIDNSLLSFGFELQGSDFSPHLTLGRMKQIHDRSQLRKLIASFNNIEWMRQSVESIILYESKLKPDGPEYLPLKESFFI